MNFFDRIKALVRKEFRSLLGHPSSRALLIMPVLLQTIVFPAAATLDVKNASIAVFNQDAGQKSVELMQRFAASGAFTQFHAVTSQDQIERMMESRDALVAVTIPVDFSRQIEAGNTGTIQALLDGRRSNSSQIAFSYLQNIVEDYQKELHPNQIPSEIVVRSWFNPNLEYKWFVLPNLVAVITTIGALIVTALSVAREREQGTFDQLLVSPLTPEMIMAGKAVPAVVIAFAQATIIMLVAILIYHVPFRGNILLLYGGMFFYAMSLVGVGLLISAVCSTQQQAFLGAFSFMMPAMMLSGFAAPVENMPHWLQIATWPNPVRHFNEIVKGVFLKDASLPRVLSLIGPLIVISSVTLSSAAVMFRRKTA